MAQSLTVAIMQPYFLPYAGYFRLFAASDLFVIYDCVQFPRRGWVHRNRFLDATGEERWLTLPIAKAPREALIRELRFVDGVREALRERLRPLPIFAVRGQPEPDILTTLRDIGGTPVDYLERLLHDVVAHLGLQWNVIRSSTLRLPDTLHGQGRIIEIARRVGATTYVNAPGGRRLYDAPTFDNAGIQLRFLGDYHGPSASILRRIFVEEAGALAEDIRGSSHPTG
jgi:hypothetical protein